jgi:hypothetical protein
MGAWVVTAVIFIVGLHFMPLARIFRYAPHYVSGAALILVAVVYPFAAPGGPQDPVGCLAAALILWLSALCGLRQALR